MRRFTLDQIEAAMRAVDAACTERHSFVLVGGAAVALHTRNASSTQDIDYFSPTAGLDRLIQQCMAEDGELPPFSEPGVLEFPWNPEDRVEPVLKDLRWLEVWLLEPHDLVLSKVVRWHDGDEEDVLELQQAKPLSQDLLIERYVHEMTHVNGSPQRIDLNFIECIARLFGDLAADDTREVLGLRREQV